MKKILIGMAAAIALTVMPSGSSEASVSAYMCSYLNQKIAFYSAPGPFQNAQIVIFYQQQKVLYGCP